MTEGLGWRLRCAAPVGLDPRRPRARDTWVHRGPMGARSVRSRSPIRSLTRRLCVLGPVNDRPAPADLVGAQRTRDSCCPAISGSTPDDATSNTSARCINPEPASWSGLGASETLLHDSISVDFPRGSKGLEARALGRPRRQAGGPISSNRIKPPAPSRSRPPSRERALGVPPA